MVNTELVRPGCGQVPTFPLAAFTNPRVHEDSHPFFPPSGLGTAGPVPQKEVFLASFARFPLCPEARPQWKL